MSFDGTGIETNEIDNGFSLNEDMQVSLRMNVEIACVKEKIKQTGSKSK